MWASWSESNTKHCSHNLKKKKKWEKLLTVSCRFHVSLSHIVRAHVARGGRRLLFIESSASCIYYFLLLKSSVVMTPSSSINLGNSSFFLFPRDSSMYLFMCRNHVWEVIIIVWQKKGGAINMWCVCAFCLIYRWQHFDEPGKKWFFLWICALLLHMRRKKLVWKNCLHNTIIITVWMCVISQVCQVFSLIPLCLVLILSSRFFFFLLTIFRPSRSLQ